jgi:hypothetical protein
MSRLSSNAAPRRVYPARCATIVGGMVMLLAVGACARPMAREAENTLPAEAATPIPAPTDTLAASRDAAMQEVLRRIAGREREPAESVFTNIRMLRGVPAGRIPRMMNLGFARSLGVGCDHCHLPGDWASEAKPQKQIAREMMAMADSITRRMLPRIANLRSEQPIVNCTTCHRGQIRPAIEMPSSPTGAPAARRPDG